MARQDAYGAATPANGDFVTGVDVSDPTHNAAGSTKRFTFSDIATYVASTLGNLATSPARTAESFGAIATAHGGTPVDNLAAIQAAIDWSAANGGTVLFGHGEYGFSGTLDFKANAALAGQGEHQTTLRQLNTSWPSCLVPAHANGNGMNTLMNLTIDGGWDKKAVFGTGSNWVYSSASMTQVGVQLSCPTTGPTQQRIAYSDMQSRILNVGIRNIAGTGLKTAGRGEIQINGLHVSSVANDGIVMGAPDNFLHEITCFLTGNRGMLITDGNQRMSNVKCWFNGMKVSETPDAAFEIKGSATPNVIATALAIQDSWGPAMKLEGVSHNIQAQIAEAFGLFADYALGNTTPPATPALINVGNLDDSYIVATARNRKNTTATLLPALVRFLDAGARRNLIEIAPDRSSLSSGAVTFYDDATPITAVSGYTNAKRFNVVKKLPNQLIHGVMTAAQLADAAHDVNIWRGFGAQVLRSDGVWVTWNGTAWA